MARDDSTRAAGSNQVCRSWRRHLSSLIPTLTAPTTELSRWIFISCQSAVVSTSANCGSYRAWWGRKMYRSDESIASSNNELLIGESALVKLNASFCRPQSRGCPVRQPFHPPSSPCARAKRCLLIQKYLKEQAGNWLAREWLTSSESYVEGHGLGAATVAPS